MARDEELDDERELEVVSSTATASAICKQSYNVTGVKPCSCDSVKLVTAKNGAVTMEKEKD